MTRLTRHEARIGLKMAIGLLLAVGLPALGCYCYYAVNDVSAERAAWAPAVGLAVPLALVGGVGLAAALLAVVRRPLVVRGCAFALAASMALLVIAESHAFGF